MRAKSRRKLKRVAETSLTTCGKAAEYGCNQAILPRPIAFSGDPRTIIGAAERLGGWGSLHHEHSVEKYGAMTVNVLEGGIGAESASEIARRAAVPGSWFLALLNLSRRRRASAKPGCASSSANAVHMGTEPTIGLPAGRRTSFTPTPRAVAVRRYSRGDTGLSE